MPQLPLLPAIGEIETKVVLKKAARAHQALAELKGVVAGIPNQAILINTLALQEAKDSSAIENIITTQDQLYQSDRNSEHYASLAAKEVHNYAFALHAGFAEVLAQGLLTERLIIEMQQCIEENNAGYRTQSGTVLKNQFGEVVYEPPQHADDIIHYMRNLEQFINDDALCDWDDLIKMAVIHHQFESIHPFYDGNGRTGRIINILYLVKQKLLDLPILYLSRYINKNKAQYYQLLQHVRDHGEWETWILFMLEAVELTSIQTIHLIKQIRHLLHQHKTILREQLPKIYSQDLINHMFCHPYTKIDFVVNELQVTRQTASRYLDDIVAVGLLSKHKIGKDNFYINDDLFQLLSAVGEQELP